MLLLAGFLAAVLAVILVIEQLDAPPDPAALEPDQDMLVLRLGGPPPEGAVEDVDYHVVGEGETLGSIAHDLLGDAALADELARLNDLSDPDRLSVGQVIRLR